MNLGDLRITPARITLTLVCLALGIVVAAQWRTQSSISQPPILPSNTDQAVMTRSLVESNALLRAEIAQLTKQLDTLRESNTQDTLPALVDELNRLKIISGLVQVSGPGIRVLINEQITMYEAQDVINELRNAGAEALSLNNHRLIASSRIQAHGEGISVDGAMLTLPYVYEAIGDPETLRQACERRGGIFDLIESSHAKLVIEIQNRQTLVLPVYRETLVFNYAVVAP